MTEGTTTDGTGVPAAPPPTIQAALRFRLAAMLYDAVAIVGIWVGSIVTLVTVTGDAVVGAWVQSLLFVELYAYFAFFWCRRGQTPGMLAWRLRIECDGQFRPSQALVRFVAGLASIATLGLGFMWMWFDAEKRTWGDRLSESHVVRGPKRPK